MPAPHRARALSNRHMIAAGNSHAALVGMNILEAGGNAVDAGVAAGITLGVTNCDQVNFGGVAPIMIRMAGTGKVMTISGLGWWPKAANIEYFHENFGGKIPPGLLRTVMPAAPDAWIKALQLYGTMTFGEVVAGAKRLAGEGYPATTLNGELMAANADGYARWPSNAEIFLPGGKPTKAGEVFYQRDLAKTMQYMVDEEAAAKGDRLAGLKAARDAFYKGDIAAKIADYHKENGGWVTREDLAEYESGHEEPYAVDFMGFTVYGCGPWCQGPIILERLNILDGVDLKSMGHNSPQYLHTIIEALNLSYADRHVYQGDPRFVDVPMDELLDKAYGAKRRALIDPAKWRPRARRRSLALPGAALCQSVRKPAAIRRWRWTPPLPALWTRMEMYFPPHPVMASMARRRFRGSALCRPIGVRNPGPIPRIRPAWRSALDAKPRYCG